MLDIKTHTKSPDIAAGRLFNVIFEVSRQRVPSLTYHNVTHVL